MLNAQFPDPKNASFSFSSKIESEIVWLQELSLLLAKMSLTMERAKMKTGPLS